jgi:hypothetical protein
MMRNLVQQLIAEERDVASDSNSKNRAAFRVCEKLRAPLCTLAGVAGFRSLLARALVLAKADAPLLAGVQVQPDGTFLYSPDLEQQLTSVEAAKAGAALSEELVGLLITFIGEALTLRLVHEVWPKMVFKDPRSTGKWYEKKIHRRPAHARRKTHGIPG